MDLRTLDNAKGHLDALERIIEDLIKEIEDKDLEIKELEEKINNYENK